MMNGVFSDLRLITGGRMTTLTDQTKQLGKQHLRSDEKEFVEALNGASFDADLALADEMARLSTDERTKALEDVHAVPSEITESSEMVKEELEAFDEEIRNSQSYAYQLAIEVAKNLEYVYAEDVDVRLSFLRTECYDGKAAARRMLRFLEHKLSLFGEQTLNRDLCLDDLSKDDMESLKSGSLQLLRELDAAGRPVMILAPKFRKFQTFENQLRVMMYMFDTIPRKSAKRGVVGLYYNNSDPPAIPLPLLLFKMTKLRNSLPFRVSAVHFCFRNQSKKIFINSFQKIWFSVSLQSTHARAQQHFGTDIEVQYSLKGFGLPIGCFPISQDGTMDLQYIEEWIVERERMENMSRNVLGSFPGCPNPLDIRTQGQPTNLEALQNNVNHSVMLESNSLSRRHNNGNLAGPGFHSLNGSLPIHRSIPVQSPGLFFKPAKMTPPSPEATNVPPLPSSPNGMFGLVNNNKVTPIQNAFGGWDLTSAGQSQGDCLRFPPSAAVVGGDIQKRPVTPVSVTSRPTIGMDRQGRLSPDRQDNDGPEIYSIIPKPEDVLFGRGKPFRNHPGNIRFRKMMEKHIEEYEEAEKFTKVLVAQRLVRVVLNTGCRFLKPSYDKETKRQYWVVVDSKGAQEKISQFFRSQRGK